MEALIALEESKKIQVGSFVVQYDNKKYAEQTIHEIFYDQPYLFNTTNPAPIIIDAGSGIGVSVLFFKSLYPQAEITCFEPEPHVFNTLKNNIQNNKLTGVTPYNCALAGKEGLVDFFGKFNPVLQDTRSNSMMAPWGSQQKNSESISVPAVKLSSYINTEIDFLKLDIEACEQEVLTELVLSSKLSMIKEMVIEIHHLFRLRDCNNAATIFSLLRRNHFELTLSEKNAKFLYLGKTKDWARSAKPRLLTLRAVRL